MKRGITAFGLEPTDLFTSIEVAEAAGYEAVELRTYMVASFLAQGHTVKEIVDKLKSLSIWPNLIGAVLDIDMPEGPERDELIANFRRSCEVMREIGCPGIQVCSGNRLYRQDWPWIRKQTAKGLQGLADVAAEYGVTLVYEPLAWMPVCNTAKVLEVMEEAERDNVQVLVDSFQIFAGEDDLETIGNLDPKIIGSVHLGDTAAKNLDTWSDDDRYTMPGDGVAPLKEIMRAILDTGYDGVITDEIYAAKYTSWSRLRLAETLKAKADSVLASL